MHGKGLSKQILNWIRGITVGAERAGGTVLRRWIIEQVIGRKQSFNNVFLNQKLDPLSPPNKKSWICPVIPSFNVLNNYVICFFQVGGSSHHLNFDKLCEITPLKILSKINSISIGGKCPGATVLISLKVYISLWLK